MAIASTAQGDAVQRSTGSFDSLFNFRDLGGMPTDDGGFTRHDVLYRSDGLHRATARDRRVVWKLGVRRIIDLRTAAEKVVDGSYAPAEPDTQYWHIPVVDDLEGWQGDEQDLCTNYQKLLQRAGPRIAGVAERLVSNPTPAVLHCTAGKDRTGVVVAVLLAAVGATDDAVADDYARSADAMPALIEWYRDHRGIDEAELSTEVTARTLRLSAADRETMLGLLDHLRERWGSAALYLQAAGAEPEVLEELRTRLVVFR